MRLGIGGPSCSGKTTLASQVAAGLAAARVSVSVHHTDDYLIPESIRPRRAPPHLGYFEDAVDYVGFFAEVRRAEVAGPDVVLGEGEFILRHEYLAIWDIKVRIEVTDELMIERGTERDAGFFGSQEKARSVYAEVLAPANHFHRQRDNPGMGVDILLRSERDGVHVSSPLRAGEGMDQGEV